MSSSLSIPPASNEPRNRLITEEEPLPTTREGLVKLFSSILSRGGVQKVIVEVGKKIKISRVVPNDGIPDVPEEIKASDTVSAARNSEMVELVLEGKKSPFEILYMCFSLISLKRYSPHSVLVKSFSDLGKWLSDKSITQDSEVFGIPIICNPEIPDDVILVAACKFDEPGDIVFSVKTLMEVPSEHFN